MPTPAHRANYRVCRRLYLGLAYGCVGLAMAGVIVPLLPTTPFLLVAVWAARKGSPRLHAWLYRHPRLESLLRNWQEHRAIPRRVKVVAVMLLSFSWLWILVHALTPLMPIVTGLLFVGIGIFILTRRSPLPASRHMANSGAKRV